MFTGYWTVLVLDFPEMGNTVFFEPKSWWKDDIYWLLESSCFELFGNEKYDIFLNQKVDGRNGIYLVFLSFPGYSIGKNVFLCNVKYTIRLLSDGAFHEQSLGKS